MIAYVKIYQVQCSLAQGSSIGALYEDRTPWTWNLIYMTRSVTLSLWTLWHICVCKYSIFGLDQWWGYFLCERWLCLSSNLWGLWKYFQLRIMGLSSNYLVRLLQFFKRLSNNVQSILIIHFPFVQFNAFFTNFHKHEKDIVWLRVFFKYQMTNQVPNLNYNSDCQ